MSLREATDLVERAIAFACEQGLEDLLIDATGVSGFAPPTLSDKYGYTSRWAAAAGGKVRAAMIARPEWIDPQKFGVIVAANRGFAGNVFLTKAEAIAWLDEGAGRVEPGRLNNVNPLRSGGDPA